MRKILTRAERKLKKKGILKSILYTPSYFAFLLVLNHYVPLSLLYSFIYFHLVTTCPLIIEKTVKFPGRYVSP